MNGEVRVISPRLFRQVALSLSRQTVVDVLNDRVFVHGIVQCLADSLILKLLLGEIEPDVLDEGCWADVDGTVSELASLCIMIGSDALNGGVVDLTRLELREHHSEIGNILEDKLLQVWPVAVIFRVSCKRNVITGNTLAPNEGPGANRRIVEVGGIRVSCFAQDVLGYDECRGQDGDIGSVGLLHRPGNFGRASDVKGLDQIVPETTAGLEVIPHDEFPSELHIVSRERLAIVPNHTVMKLDLPNQAVSRDAAIFDRRHLGSEHREILTLFVNTPKRIKQVEIDAVIDLNVRHQWIKDRRLL